AGMAPLGAEAGSGEESYRRLSSDFHAAVDEGTRKQIIERLENDRCSENPSTRLLAVQSMARIDPELFESALVAATEDDNVAVRDAAVEALRTI
ncbi:MAG: HEAT repeat domain-containing protein, partial [Polyangiales bacterium]